MLLLCCFQARNNIQDMHELQEEKLLLSQIKQKTTVEKSHMKASKRANKSGNMDEVSRRNQEEINNLLAEQEVKVWRGWCCIN